MIAQQHIASTLEGTRLTPTAIRNQGQNYTTALSFSMTLSVTPIEGSFMCICVGGTQNRLMSISGTGWIQRIITGNMSVFHKFAEPSETTSITVTFDGNMQGSILYFEFGDIDGTPLIGSPTSTSFSGVTTASLGSYSVTEPCVVIQDIAFDNVHTWSVDNSFNPTGGTVRAFAAYKIYSNPTSETTTWSGDSAIGNLGMIQFRGKLL